MWFTKIFTDDDDNDSPLSFMMNDTRKHWRLKSRAWQKIFSNWEISKVNWMKFVSDVFGCLYESMILELLRLLELIGFFLQIHDSTMSEGRPHFSCYTKRHRDEQMIWENYKIRRWQIDEWICNFQKTLQKRAEKGLAVGEQKQNEHRVCFHFTRLLSSIQSPQFTIYTTTSSCEGG